MAKRISVINFKGGVGKTAVTLHLATGLAKYHNSRVLLVDVDHQSTLSLICLGGTDWVESVDKGKTINAIFKHFVTQNVPLPNKDIITKRPYGNRYQNLDIIPATLQLDETELDLTSTTVGDPIASEWHKRTLICKWIEENSVDEDYDYIIFDCPPATKLVTQNAIACSHCYIIPTIPDAVSIRGIPHLIERVFTKIDGKFSGLAQYLSAKGKKIYDTYIPSTKLAGIVINKIKTHGMAYSGYTTDHTRHLSNITSLFPDDVIEPYIVEGVGVPECLSRGYPVYNYPDEQNVRSRGFVSSFRELTRKLKKRSDNL